MRVFPLLVWTGGVLVVLAAAIAIAFVVSPWPSVLIIQRTFAGGDTASEAALEKHVPPGIVSVGNVAYGQGPDEIFDINYPPGAAPQLPAIIWVHGGGWVAGSKEGVANYLRILAGYGYVTVGVEYSTAPGATYPTPVRQVNDALKYLLAHAAGLGIDPSAIILAGDSAGAQIAAQLALLSTDADYSGKIGIAPALTPAQLRGIILVSGAYDINGLKLDGPFGGFINTVLWAYSGVKDFLNDEQFKLVSVTQYATAAFPPAFISSGNADPLGPQAVALATKLETLGVPVDALFFPPDHAPLEHEYQFNLDTAAGQEALDRIVDYLSATLAR